MESFLKLVTQDIYNKYSGDFSNICIVLPNKRPELYIQKYLSEISDKTIIVPKIFTINELVSNYSNLIELDDLTLTYKLFNSFKKYLKTNEDFDKFYFWGQMLLNDFDDIDKELVDAEIIFKNLAEVKEYNFLFDYLSDEQIELIELFWGAFKTKKSSKNKQQFLEIWNKLYDIYTDFNKSLRTESFAYPGMIYRDVYNNLSEGKINFDYDKYIFVGFNALNKVEEEILSSLKKENKAEFYWDYDIFYTSHKNHEANHFLKKNLKKFPSQFENDFNNLTNTGKNVEIISVSSRVGQVKLIPDIIHQLQKDKDFDINSTAIVLADEELLVPLMYSLPQDVEHLNITMGFPFKATTVFNFINELISLQNNINKSQEFYFKDVKTILSNPLILQQNADDAKKIITKIVEDNLAYISRDELILNDFYSRIFSICQPQESIKYIIEILEILLENTKNANFEREFIFEAFKSLNKLQTLINTSGIELKTTTYFSIVKTVLSGLSIPFEGEPLGGLQIMGMLETRLLDFDNIIIISMNEGVLPKTGASPSFIPYNIRKAFKIPDIQYQDAIFAYYFYRLLQRAKNIKLIYNSAVSPQNKEKSRFLTQIILENIFPVKEKNISFETSVNNSQEIEIKKDKNVQEKLENFTEISPSAINTYLDCRLKFYFKYIAGIKEPDEVTEELDPAVFGSILHEAMEFIYKDKEQTKELVTEVFIDSVIKNNELVESTILKAFSNNFFNKKPVSKEKLHGRNIIIFEVIKKYVVKLLEKDKQIAPFTIYGLEKKYHFDIQLNNKKTIKTGGTIDRINKKDDTISILDYKTGKVDVKFPDIESLFDVNNKNRASAVLQTFIYSEAFLFNNKTTSKIMPGIIPVRNVFSDNFDTGIYHQIDKKTSIAVEDYKNYREEFLFLLKNTVNQIFSSEENFSQTENTDKCKYCNYKIICKR